MSKASKRHPQAPKRKGSNKPRRKDSQPRDNFDRPQQDRPKGPPWLYGRHAVIAALENPERQCHRLVVSEDFLKSHGPELKKAIEATTRNRPETETLERREIEDLTQGGVHQGIALQVAPLPRTTLEELIPELEAQADALVIALDQATDPQNIGAVLRSAAAFGAQAVLIPDKNAPEVSAAMAKAACGALERLPFIRVTNLARSMEQLKEAGFWSVGLDGYADTTLSQIDLRGKTLLVMGSEGTGLRRLTREKCDFLAKIPISQAVESLNLSNATAVALYEISRQKFE